MGHTDAYDSITIFFKEYAKLQGPKFTLFVRLPIEAANRRWKKVINAERNKEREIETEKEKKREREQGQLLSRVRDIHLE